MSTRIRTHRKKNIPAIPWLNQPFRQLTSPIPPLNWVTEDGLEQIHDASMRILEEVGMAFMDAEALSLWEKAGAKVDHAAQQVWIDRGLLLELVRRAPSTFTWQARRSDYSLTIGGNHINFAPTAGMPYVSDLRVGRRSGTLADFENFVKLAHTIPYLHFAGGPLVEPQDIPLSLRHLHRMRVMVSRTDKAIRSVAHGRVIPEDIVAMLKLVFGDPLPGVVTGAVVNVTSPLRLDDRMIGGIIQFARSGQALIVTPFIMAGATSPITISSALAQQNAEALGGIALAQLVNPGAPVVYGGFVQNADMRSGSPAFSSPEGAWGTLAGAQMARRYHLPYRASGSLTNSPVADAQAAYESQWSLWPAVLSHANVILHAAGMMENMLVASYEKFVMDTEALGMVHQMFQNFAINEDTLAVQDVAEAGVGGHHFGSERTQAHYKTAFYEPALTTRQSFEQWTANGEQDALHRAHHLWQELLRAYEPPPIDSSILAALDEFIARRETELAGVDLYA
jgi:trimethylamine---corrinoid protein Co-methyltransferase